jgi:hypothetical protein
MSRVRDDRVARIRADAAAGRSVAWIAATFGVDHRTVQRAIDQDERGQGWGNDEPPAAWEHAVAATEVLASLPVPLADWLDALTDAVDPSGSCVYFVQQVGAPWVKIGVTRTVNAPLRLAQLQIGNPSPLALRRLVAGDFYAEAVLHAAFADRRIRGEWFDADADLARIGRLEP